MIKALGWIWFCVIQLVAFLAMLLGWVLLIPFSYLRWWQPGSSVHIAGRDITIWKYRLVDAVWGNDEDGCVGPGWYNPNASRSRTYLWSAWRNSANNLRWIFAWKGGPFWRHEWRGWYGQAGFRLDTGWPVLSAGKL